jgi:O-antigen/teichoic acid export membrane protein
MASTQPRPAVGATQSPPEVDPYAGRFDGIVGSLRHATARGTIVNAGFTIGLDVLTLLKGFVVAAFLSTSDYGIWGLLVVSLGAFALLKQVGVGDKYVQQEEPDQELAFQKAFTLDLVLNLIVFVAILASLPAFALLYGQDEIILPGLVVGLALPAAALQTPQWVYYRRLAFVRQRLLQAVDPVVGFCVTVGLAVAGFGYWSLVIGFVCGTWAGGIVAMALAPYRLAIRYERGTLRDYAAFSWPLFVAQAAGVVMSLAAVIAGNAVLGVAGVGIMSLAASVALYAEKVDSVVTTTLYPAVCAVRDRTELLFEAFTKSNRLALMWGVPFGVGVALFAGDLVEFVIGERWRPVVGLLQVYGLLAAANQVGFNWTAFFRARGETKPMAVVALAGLAAFIAVAIPLLIADGLDGFAIGMAVSGAVTLVGRTLYLQRLFRGFRMLGHSLRAAAPVLPAVAVVLGLRAAFPDAGGAGFAAAQLALFVGVTVAATLALERPLLREVVGYVRHGSG